MMGDATLIYDSRKCRGTTNTAIALYSAEIQLQLINSRATPPRERGSDIVRMCNPRCPHRFISDINSAYCKRFSLYYVLINQMPHYPPPGQLKGHSGDLTTPLIKFPNTGEKSCHQFPFVCPIGDLTFKYRTADIYIFLL